MQDTLRLVSGLQFTTSGQRGAATSLVHHGRQLERNRCAAGWHPDQRHRRRRELCLSGVQRHQPGGSLSRSGQRALRRQCIVGCDRADHGARDHGEAAAAIRASMRAILEPIIRKLRWAACTMRSIISATSPASTPRTAIRTARSIMFLPWAILATHSLRIFKCAPPHIALRRQRANPTLFCFMAFLMCSI